MFCFVIFWTDSKSLTLSVRCSLVLMMNVISPWPVESLTPLTHAFCGQIADCMRRKDLDLLICIYWTDFHLHEVSHLVFSRNLNNYYLVVAYWWLDFFFFFFLTNLFFKHFVLYLIPHSFNSLCMNYLLYITS